MKFTYYGHSCFAVETCGKTLLFDPFIRPNPLAAGVAMDQIRADYLLISHGHFDHIADAVELAQQTGATVVSNFEIISWLEKQGLKNVHPMNIGGAWNFDFGRVKSVNALHSSQLPDGSNGGSPGGFVVATAEGAFYYAGDTALTLDMKLIPEEFPLKFAILPIGDNFTMGAADGARAASLLQCQTIVGVHYDTFPWIKISPGTAASAFQTAGATLHLPAIGQTITL
ncbi:MAG TPA: metal-dependent hydrolase [Terrimicrobiaceae bacterium]|nr:metal-dependent hydrolase [Terrimicrobiaceae bacterium]